MDWFNNIPMRWRIITGAAFSICWVGMYRLGKQTGRKKTIEACAERAAGNDYTWRTEWSIRDDFEAWA